MSKWDHPWSSDEIQKLLDQEKRWREALIGDSYGQIKRLMESQVRDFRSEIERMLDGATLGLAQISERGTPRDELTELLKSIGQDQERNLLLGGDRLELAIQSHTSRMADISAVAESLFARTDWESLYAPKFAVPDLTVNLESVSRQLASDYRSLVDSFVAGQIYTISPDISALSPVEMLLAGGLAYSLAPSESASDSEEPEIAIVQEVRTDVIGSELPGLGILLGRINPNLRVMLDGARHALIGNNPDRVRHVTTTLREIFTQVLHHLSPDSDLTAWSNEPSYFSNGRPTRRARLLFIVRHIQSTQLTRFLESDVKAALEFLDAFQAGTHGPPGNFTDGQLRAMLVRMEGLLRFILEIKGSGNGGSS